MSSKNDEKIKELLEIINLKRKNLGKKPKIFLRTNALLEMEGENILNINTIQRLSECINIVSKILHKQELYTRAAKILDIEIKENEHKISGFPVNDWIADLKSKADLIKWNIENKNIKAIEAKLKNLRSEELKTSDELDDISTALE
jgi:hypothetical protein